MKCLYYPGCSQKAASSSYERSLLAICPQLGIDLVELQSWNCCGTTTVVSVNKILSLTLSARNLALAEPFDLPVVTPCPSCCLSLNRANHVLRDGRPDADKVREALSEGGLKYGGGTKVRHILEFLVNEVGLAKIRENVRSPLKSLKVAPYYGCQVVRPYAEGDDAENPQNLERVIETVSAKVADFALRASCCGGVLMVTNQRLAEAMSVPILKSATEANADMVVTPCGLCQVNLQLASRAREKTLGEEVHIPVLNIAQLIGLAFGLELKQLGLDRSMLPDARLGLLCAPEPAAQ